MAAEQFFVVSEQIQGLESKFDSHRAQTEAMEQLLWLVSKSNEDRAKSLFMEQLYYRRSNFLS